MMRWPPSSRTATRRDGPRHPSRANNPGDRRARARRQASPIGAPPEKSSRFWESGACPVTQHSHGRRFRHQALRALFRSAGRLQLPLLLRRADRHRSRQGHLPSVRRPTPLPGRRARPTGAVRRLGRRDLRRWRAGAREAPPRPPASSGSAAARRERSPGRRVRAQRRLNASTTSHRSCHGAHIGRRVRVFRVTFVSKMSKPA